MTVGERAEDVFYVTDFDGRPLDADGRRSGCGRASRARSTGAMRHEPRAGAADESAADAAACVSFRAPRAPQGRRAAHRPGSTPIDMSIGEPQHEPPAFVLATLRDNLHRLGTYPATAGLPELRSACARWLERRFAAAGTASIPPPWCCRSTARARRCSPSCRQRSIRGARRAAGADAESVLSDLRGGGAAGGSASPFSRHDGRQRLHARSRCRAGEHLAALSGVVPVQPGQPDRRGAAARVSCAARSSSPSGYDFIIAADECYTEIYLDERSPPPGLLQACLAAGHDRFERCVVFHSLSKRSSVPGLRSGFVGGRSRDPVAVSPLPDLSWQRHAGADAACEHRGLAGR